MDVGTKAWIVVFIFGVFGGLNALYYWLQDRKEEKRERNEQKYQKRMRQNSCRRCADKTPSSPVDAHILEDDFTFYVMEVFYVRHVVLRTRSRQK